MSKPYNGSTIDGNQVTSQFKNSMEVDPFGYFFFVTITGLQCNKMKIEYFRKKHTLSNISTWGRSFGYFVIDPHPHPHPHLLVFTRILMTIYYDSIENNNKEYEIEMLIEQNCFRWLRSIVFISKGIVRPSLHLLLLKFPLQLYTLLYATASYICVIIRCINDCSSFI